MTQKNTSLPLPRGEGRGEGITPNTATSKTVPASTPAKLALLLATLLPTPTNAAEIQILTAGAYRSVLTTLAPTFEQFTGHHLTIRTETAGGVLEKIRAKDPADLIILTPAGITALADLVRPNSMRPLAKVGIAIAVPKGAPRPDISTPEAVRAAVLAARAPAWIDPAAGGSSGIYMAKLWETWGIAAQLAPKAVLVQGGLVSDRLTNGTADLAFQQRSELENHGVDVLGPLPPSIQTYTTYAGAIPASSTQPEAAAALLTFLSSSVPVPTLLANGMQTP